MRFPMLLCLPILAPARGDDPAPPAAAVRAALDRATATVERGLAERGEAYRAADEGPGTPAEREARFEAAAAKYRATIAPGVDALLDAAADRPADPATLDALRFVLIQARPLTATGQVDRAIDLLRRDHVRAPNVAPAIGLLWLYHDKPAAIELLRAVAAENPDPAERARACYFQAALLKQRVESAERFRRRSPGTPFPSQWQGADLPALRAEAVTLYGRCLAEHAAVPVGDAPGKTIGDYAPGELATIRDLVPGRVAPEIAGTDVAGRPLRLGAYRGKVVVLVFAGEWCGPCRAAAPYFRDLLAPAAQQAAACVVLEVNTDATPDPVRAAIAAGEVAWPCWLDGGTAGPITSAWGITSFPAIFVLDAEGVIRARDLRGEDTAAAVAQALAEHPPGPRP